MTFLAGICSQLLIWIIEKAGAAIAALVQKFKREKQITDDATASVQPLIDAKTPEAIEKAARDALNDI